MWQFCHVCRRAPLLCVAITLTKVYLFFFISFCAAGAVWAKNYEFSFMNELDRLSVSNLVEVFFIIHIENHIYPTSGCHGRKKIRGLNFHYPPHPLHKLTAPLFLFHHSQTWFCRRLTFGRLSESIDKFVSSLNSHRNWVSEERNQLNLRYSCHGRVVSSLYPEFNSLENNDKN